MEDIGPIQLPALPLAKLAVGVAAATATAMAVITIHLRQNHHPHLRPYHQVMVVAVLTMKVGLISTETAATGMRYVCVSQPICLVMCLHASL